MYFWKIHQLKADLQKENLSQASCFSYLLATLTLFEVVRFPSAQETASTLDYIEYAFAIMATVAGTFYCYKANGSSTGKDFLGRYFSIGWVCSIRSIVFGIPAMIAYTVLAVILIKLMGFNPSNYSKAIPQSFVFIFTPALYWRIIHHISTLRHPEV